jgi:long-chain fatty acid transport protein
LKNTLQRFSMIVMLLFMVQFTSFAGGFQLNEHGARAMAQGGAWAARAYDGSAMFFNPAGLGFQKENSLYLGSTIIMPTASYNDPLRNNKKTDMVSQVFTPINVYGTYRINDDINVGLGINNPYGLGSEWPATWDGRKISIKVDLMSFFFTPTVSYKVNDQLSLGIGANIVTGNVTINRVVDVPPLFAEPTVTLDLSAMGYGFNLGALYKVSPEISVGVSYRSAVSLDATGTAKFTNNNTLLNLPEGDAAASLTLPATAFIGVAVKPMENLELEADYQYVGWSSYDKLTIEFKKDPTKNSTADKKYENTYIIRVGGEYTMDALQIRAGYLFDNSPVLPKYVDPMLPDANRNGINIGAGYKVTPNITVDISYLMLIFDQAKAEGTDNGFDGTYDAGANLFGFNVGYTF